MSRVSSWLARTMTPRVRSGPEYSRTTVSLLNGTGTQVTARARRPLQGFGEPRERERVFNRDCLILDFDCARTRLSRTRPPVRRHMQRCLLTRVTAAAGLAFTLGAVGPAVAAAQDDRPGARGTIEPYAGVFWNRYDVGRDRSRLGGIAGLRAGYGGNSIVRLVGNVAYAHSGDVGGPMTGASYFVYDNDWIVATGGAETQWITAGRSSAALGIEVGAAWRRTVRDGQVGTPTDDGYGRDDWSPVDLVVPSFAARYRVGARTTMSFAFRAHVSDMLEGGNKISPAVTLGLSFR